MTLRNLLNTCTPRTVLLITTRTRYTRITCGCDIRTLYTLQLLGKEVTSIRPTAKDEMEVHINEDSENR